MPPIRLSQSLFSAARSAVAARGPTRLLTQQTAALPVKPASRFSAVLPARSARLWSHSARLGDASHSSSKFPSTPTWGFQQVQGASRRLQDTELHGHTVNHGLISIIDVREPGEYNSGHIPSAVNVPLSAIKKADESVSDSETPSLQALKQALTELVPEQSEDLQSLIFGKIEPSSAGEIAGVDAVVYCRAGVRSAAAIEILERFIDGNEPPIRLHNYAGSWNDWTAKGGDVARPDLD